MRVKIDDIEIDATPEQDYQAEVELTDHPVENGFNPTDHARSKPETWTATCVVSSMPVDQDQRDARGPFTSGAKGGYARYTFERIRRMKDEHKTHTLTTPLRRYENMVITALSSPTRAQYGDGVVFKISLKQIRVVQSATVALVNTSAPKPNTDKPTTKTEQAKKQGEAVKDQSIADKAARYLFPGAFQ